jgi:hypothetical protein
VTLDPSLHAALASVCEALRTAARTETDRLLTAVDAETAEAIAAARAQAAALVTQAQTEGAADAAIAVAGARSRTRRRARAVVMRARRDAYQALQEASRAKIRLLRDEPDYRQLLDRFTAAARAQLGANVTIIEVPGSGILAEEAGRRIDYSLDGFADRAVDALGADSERLWAP